MKERRKSPPEIFTCSAVLLSLLPQGREGDRDIRKCDISLTLGRDRKNALILGCYIHCNQVLRPTAPIC